jgi:hypothetical protein
MTLTTSMNHGIAPRLRRITRILRNTMTMKMTMTIRYRAHPSTRRTSWWISKLRPRHQNLRRYHHHRHPASFSAMILVSSRPVFQYHRLVNPSFPPRIRSTWDGRTLFGSLLLTQHRRKMERVPKASGVESRMRFRDRGRVLGNDRETIASRSAATMLIPAHSGAMGHDRETIASEIAPPTLILV